MIAVMTRPSVCEREIRDGRLRDIGLTDPVPGMEPDRERGEGEHFFAGMGLTQ